MRPVTDPDILAQLDAPNRAPVAASNRVWGDQEAESAGIYETPQRAAMKPVSDPMLLAALNGEASFDERFAFEPSQNPKLQSGLERTAQAMTRGPQVSPGQSTLADFGNLLPAAEQRTTPNISAQAPNLVSTDVFQNDAGMAMFRDPSTGQMVEADSARHVVLRDPADNKLKVFARSEDTNEMGITGAARVLAPGLAAGAATARPMIPAARAIDVQPRASEIFATAKPDYKAFQREAVKVEVPKETAAGIGERLRTALDKKDLIPELAPPVYAVIGILDKPGRVTTLDQLQSVKRAIGRSFNSPDKNVRDAAGIASAEVAKIIGEVSKPAGESLKRADAIHSTARAVQDLQRKGAVADLRAGRAGYGGNAVNSMRQVLSPIVQRAVEGKMTGFKPNEIEAMREIVEGTTATNALRGVGQLSPSKGIIQTVGAGGAMYAAGPAALAIPAIGAASNKLATFLTGKQIDHLKALVAKRSPAYAEAVKKATDRYNKAQMEFANNPSPNRFAAYLSASRALSAGLVRDGVQVSSGDLLRAIQGPMKGAAGDENPEPERVLDQ